MVAVDEYGMVPYGGILWYGRWYHTIPYYDTNGSGITPYHHTTTTTTIAVVRK